MHWASQSDGAFRPSGQSTYEQLDRGRTGWWGEGRRHPPTVPNLLSQSARWGNMSLQMRPCLGRPWWGASMGQERRSLWASLSPGALEGGRTRGSLRPFSAPRYHEMTIGYVSIH